MEKNKEFYESPEASVLELKMTSSLLTISGGDYNSFGNGGELF